MFCNPSSFFAAELAFSFSAHLIDGNSPIYSSISFSVPKSSVNSSKTFFFAISITILAQSSSGVLSLYSSPNIFTRQSLSFANFSANSLKGLFYITFCGVQLLQPQQDI